MLGADHLSGVGHFLVVLLVNVGGMVVRSDRHGALGAVAASQVPEATSESSSLGAVVVEASSLELARSVVEVVVGRESAVVEVVRVVVGSADLSLLGTQVVSHRESWRASAHQVHVISVESSWRSASFLGKQFRASLFLENRRLTPLIVPPVLLPPLSGLRSSVRLCIAFLMELPFIDYTHLVINPSITYIVSEFSGCSCCGP